MTIVDIETLAAGVPDGGTLALMRTRVLDEIGETYPKSVSAPR
jgi:hypothetical protein